jgi:RNA polymerase sigma-70 factor (ECF subfamily)
MIKADTVIDFTLVYNHYKKPLYNYVWKMLNDRTLTEDITQNVFLKYFENLPVIKNSGSPGSWLFITARNEVFNLLRKKKTRSENYINEDADYASETDIIADIEEVEIKDIIENEIKNMNEDSKEIFILREYSGLSYREISHMLGIEESIIKGRLFRMRQKLIDKISKLVR